MVKFRLWLRPGLVLLLRAGGVCSDVPLPAPFIYTEAPRYDGRAALNGGERFPAGAVLQFITGGHKRALTSGFAASADACVSFDGERVLFSGKQKPGDPWQIWEIPIHGGPPRRMVASASLIHTNSLLMPCASKHDDGVLFPGL